MDPDDSPRAEGKFPDIRDVNRLAWILCEHNGFDPFYPIPYQSGMRTEAAARSGQIIPGESSEQFVKGRRYHLWTRYRAAAEKLLIERAAMEEFQESGAHDVRVATTPQPVR